MTPPRVVIDANVVISGFLFGGNPARVLDAVLEHKAQCFTSLAILDEIRGVLLRPKFGLAPEEALSFIEEFRLLCAVVVPRVAVHVVNEDPGDDKVLECAIEAHAGFIVSGDSHLLDLREWRGIRIVSSTKFMEMIGGQRRVARYGATPRHP